MWYLVAVIIWAWAVVEDWGAVDGSLDSTEKVLQVVSSYLLNRWQGNVADTMGQIFLTALKANTDRALCDALPECNVQSRLEQLEQCILALEQEPRGPEEPIISDRW